MGNTLVHLLVMQVLRTRLLDEAPGRSATTLDGSVPFAGAAALGGSSYLTADVEAAPAAPSAFSPTALGAHTLGRLRTPGATTSTARGQVPTLCR